MSTQDRFRDLVANHMRAKMAIEGMSFEDVAQAIGMKGKNYVFRCSRTAEEQALGKYVMSVPTNLHAVLNWLELEPRDFANGDGDPTWGHLIDTIQRLPSLEASERNRLCDIVEAFLKDRP